MTCVLFIAYTIFFPHLTGTCFCSYFGLIESITQATWCKPVCIWT